MSNLSSTKIIRFLFTVLVFFTPLIFSASTYEVFEFPKMHFVYFVGSTIVFVFLVEQILRRQKITLPSVFVLLFVLANVLSTVFSSHLYTSVWGYYSRFNGGLVSILVFVGIYFVGINVFKKFSRGEVQKILIAPVFSLIPISLFGILQHYTLSASSRVYSTFGQPNWLAAYIVMVIPLVLYFLLEKDGRFSRWYKGFLAVVLVLSYSALWFTYSLSGLLGLVVAVGVFVWLNRAGVAKEIRILGWVVVVCAIVSVFNLGIYSQRVNDVFVDLKKVSAQVDSSVDNSGASNVSKQISDPGFIRTGLWTGTINLITSDPKVFIFGTGPETFPYEFQRFRSAKLNYSSEWNFILNKPHNYYLETFSEIGILGFLSYIGLVIYSLKRRHPFVTSSLAGFYVTNFFGFTTVSTALLFWVFLVLIDDRD